MQMTKFFGKVFSPHSWHLNMQWANFSSSHIKTESKLFSTSLEL